MKKNQRLDFSSNLILIALLLKYQPAQKKMLLINVTKVQVQCT